MKIECPACSASGNIDESKVPHDGRQVTCPRCSHRFRVWPERSGVEIIQQRERMVCPKCSCEQPLAEICAVCGIEVKKHLQTTVHQQEKERLEFVKLRAETRHVDAWYSNLFDRRLSSLLVRVLSLLFLLGLFMTCSMNSARRNKFYADNTEQMKKTAEGQSRGTNREINDAVFKERFNSVVSVLSDNIDRCLTQCYNYLTSWYQRESPEHYLTESMADELQKLYINRKDVKALYGQLPTPSQRYYDCYVSVRKLNNIYDDLFKYTTEYKVHYVDFSNRISNLNSEYLKVKEALNACTDIKDK
jgi:predicted Zn finger-like uncharacterized protein